MSGFHSMIAKKKRSNYTGLTDIEQILRAYFTSNYVETVKDGRRVIKVWNNEKSAGMVIYNKFEPNTRYKLSFEEYKESIGGVTGLMFVFSYTDGTIGYVSGSGDTWRNTAFTTPANKSVKLLWATYGTGTAVNYYTKGTLRLEKV